MHTIHFEEKNEKSLSNVLWSTSQIRRLSTGNDHIDHWRNTQKTYTLPCSNSRTEKVLFTLYILYIYVWNNLLLHRTCCTKPPACKSQKTNVLPWDVSNWIIVLASKKKVLSWSKYGTKFQGILSTVITCSREFSIQLSTFLIGEQKWKENWTKTRRWMAIGCVINVHGTILFLC